MSRYASQTAVPSSRSRIELERILKRYHADQFGYRESESGRVTILFSMRGRTFRFDMPMPDRQHPEFTRTAAGYRTRSEPVAVRLWQQACRQRWRALVLMVKALLEAVELGIISLEDAFLGQTVLETGLTIGQWVALHGDPELPGPALLPALDAGRAPQ